MSDLYTFGRRFGGVKVAKDAVGGLSQGSD